MNVRVEGWISLLTAGAARTLTDTIMVLDVDDTVVGQACEDSKASELQAPAVVEARRLLVDHHPRQAFLPLQLDLCFVLIPTGILYTTIYLN
jgi:hypothetical protein